MASKARWNPLFQFLHRIGTEVASISGFPSCCVPVARPKGCISPWVSHRCGPEIWRIQHSCLQRRKSKGGTGQTSDDGGISSQRMISDVDDENSEIALPCGRSMRLQPAAVRRRVGAVVI